MTTGITVAARLDAAVKAACPILGVSVGTQGDSSSVRINFDPSATTQQRTDAQAAVDAFDWSDPAQVSYENLQSRTQAVTLLSDPQPSPKVLRAVLLLTLDEINLLRQRDADRAADVAAATSLANLQTRWAARAALAQRTAAQLRTAITNKLNAGDADN